MSSDTKPHKLGHRYIVTPTRRVAPNSSITRPHAVLLRAPQERLLACRLALLPGILRASRADAAALLDDYPVHGARKIKPDWPAAPTSERSVERQRGLAGRLSRSNLRGRGGQVGADERGPPGLAAGSAHAPAACSPTGWDASGNAL